MSLKGEASNLLFLFNFLADIMFGEEFLQKFIWTEEAAPALLCSTTMDRKNCNSSPGRQPSPCWMCANIAMHAEA